MAAAELGVFGGSGFYAFLDDVEHVEIDTPWGVPSAPVAIGTVGSRTVAFLPRHGARHELPPHRVNYRANLWALRELGVTRVLGPNACGSLQRGIAPGDVVVADQLVDRTWGRPDTFFDGPKVVHVSFADPYCPELRRTAIDAARHDGAQVHERGTVVVVQGPRFSTRAESEWFAGQGWDIVNMTQHPEAYLARELGLCYAPISLVTDYDAGIDDVEPVSYEQVLRVLDANVDRLRRILLTALPAVPEVRGCACAAATGGLSPSPPEP
jgi:5'-methylthioadenosine phosphorylase